MSKLNLEELLTESKLAYIIIDKEGLLIYNNKQAQVLLKLLGIEKQENILCFFKNIFPNFNLQRLLSQVEVYSYTGENKINYYFEFCAYEKKVDNKDYYVFNIYDISNYKNELIAKEIYKKIFNSVGSAIVVTDCNGSIEKVNPAFEELTGYSAAEAKGKNPRILKSGYHSKRFFEEMWKTIANGETWRGDLRDRTRTGELIWEKSVISPIIDDAGKVTKYIAIKENITKEKIQEELLKKLSYQDYLTGLYNRRRFTEYTEKLMKAAKEKDIYLFCLMIDVDDFKKVNDNYGHEVGDKVLVKLAERLKANTRGNDIASRYGGEEFIVILSKYSYEQALQRADKIRNDIANASVKTNQDTISVTASIGFAQYDYNSDISTWLQRADEALYEAKNSGKNKVCEYIK